MASISLLEPVTARGSVRLPDHKLTPIIKRVVAEREDLLGEWNDFFAS